MRVFRNIKSLFSKLDKLKKELSNIDANLKSIRESMLNVDNKLKIAIIEILIIIIAIIVVVLAVIKTTFAINISGTFLFALLLFIIILLFLILYFKEKKPLNLYEVFKLLFLGGTALLVYKLFEIFISVSEKIISANELKIILPKLALLIVLAFILGYILKLIYSMIKEE